MKLRTSLSVVLMTVLAGTAYAHMGGMPGHEGCAMSGGPQVSTANPTQLDRMKEHREFRAYRLHQVLKLTPAQEPAWQAYQEKMKAAPMNFPDRDAMAKLSTPERLDAMQAMAKEHQTVMASHAAATKEFYAQLTPEQQKAFDADMMNQGAMKHGRAAPKPAPAAK